MPIPPAEVNKTACEVAAKDEVAAITTNKLAIIIFFIVISFRID